MTYRERVRWPGFLLVALALVLVVGCVVLVGAAPTWGFALAALPLLVVAYAIWRMRFVDLEFGQEGVGFGFGRISHRVPRSRILGADAIDYPAARFMGWGYRIGWERGERAYSVIGCRRGVLLRYTDERGRNRKVFLSSRTPEAALAALVS